MKKRKKFNKRRKKSNQSILKNIVSSHLSESAEKILWSSLMFLFAVVILFGFFKASGVVGNNLTKGLFYLIGKTTYLLPFIFLLLGFSFLGSGLKNKKLIFVSAFLVIIGTSCLSSVFHFDHLPKLVLEYGGWLGYITVWPFIKAFGFWISQIISWVVFFIGLFIITKSLVSFKNKFFVREEKEETQKAESRLIKSPRKVNLLEKVKPLRKIKSPKISNVKDNVLPINVIKQGLKEKGYKFPALDLLETDKARSSVEDVRKNSIIIKRTFQDFGIPVEVAEINIGPTVTQYAISPAEGVNLSKITSLSNNLALALAAHPIRIEAPIPGKSLVGIEVPNKSRTLVRLRNLLSLPEFQNSESRLMLVLGRDVAGFPFLADLAKMPHLLVAGSTGSGKTICLNNLILSLLYRNSPSNLRLILVDPKRVEFSVYNDLPHLLTPVIFDAHKTVNALKWLVEEMERRFSILSKTKSRNIDSYNRKQKKAGLDTLPYIVLVIDELADLMAARGRDVEAGIVRLAQMARAVGIHLIVATQRPSVEVITGLIKANITSRIAFQTASQVDSRTILDMSGAEKLLGAGDMLFISAKYSKPKRIQGPYVSEQEVKKVVNYINEKNKVSPSDNLSESFEETLEKNNGSEFFTEGDDPLYEEAKKIVIASGKASSSLLQRRLRVGYARAARLIDMLEERGIVGPSRGAKPREVYPGNSDEEGDNNNEDVNNPLI